MPPFRLTPALAVLGLAGAAIAQPAPTSSVRAACAADVRKLCPAEMLQGRAVVTRCMRSHAQDLSPDCRAAAMAHRAEMKAKGPEAGDAGAPAATPPS